MTSIQWTDRTWNPVRGCTRVSEGCRNCYAERMAARNMPGMRSPTTGEPFAQQTPGGPRWTGKVELIPSKLAEPLRWRKPSRVFVNSMSDLFHESLPFNDIAAVLRICWTTHSQAEAGERRGDHVYQILTKRAERMVEFFQWLPRQRPGSGCHVLARSWPLPNVWLGVSVEDQVTADERIPLLLQTPAAKQFVSYEPALGPVDFRAKCDRCSGLGRMYGPTWQEKDSWPCRSCDNGRIPNRGRIAALDWLIVGGESGPGARPFDIAWARSTVEQCKAAGVAVFVKQLGARPIDSALRDIVCNGTVHYTRPAADTMCHEASVTPGYTVVPHDVGRLLSDSKGGRMSEWPEDLRVREFPS